MGGLHGHMPHVWENLDLSFSDIKEIFTEVTEGRSRALEKFDGINVQFTLDSEGSPRFARNSTHVRMGGLTLEGIDTEFKGHPAYRQFRDGTLAIAEAVKNGFWPLGFSRKNWVSCEIVDAKMPQTFNYDHSAVVLHGATAYTSQGRATNIDLSRQFNKLVEQVSGFTTVVGDNEWHCLGPVSVDLINLSGEGILSETIKNLEFIMNVANLEWSSSLREWAYISLMKGVVGNINISSEKRHDLASRILDIDGAPSLVEIKKNLSTPLAKAISKAGAKKNRHRVMAQTMLPVEIMISRFGGQILEHYNSAMIDNPMDEIERLDESIKAAVLVVESNEDGWSFQRNKLMESLLSKLALINCKPAALEGICFDRTDGRYKLTGVFSAMNHILGLPRYGRGSIPPIATEKDLSEQAKDIAILKAFSTV